MNSPATYRDARRRVERKLGFYTHLMVYLAVNLGLLAVNLLDGSARPWALLPWFGWGIGLLFHGLAVFLIRSQAAWKQRMINEEMNRPSDPARQ